jgi:hypothetical protein
MYLCSQGHEISEAVIEAKKIYLMQLRLTFFIGIISLILMAVQLRL